MSYQDQSYLEEVEIAEQDLKDAQDAYEKAKIETQNAYQWETKMGVNVQSCQNRLSTLKSRD